MGVQDSLLPLWVMELLVYGFLWTWLFYLGATVGSFLNVVVYRLPRGENLAYPGSYCPRCGHAIRLHDNIPLLSWLNLRGRCRDCGGRISPRYFWVELAVATAFVLVMLAEFYLPAGLLGFSTRRLLTPRDGTPFFFMYAIHVVFVTTMIGVILMRADASVVPVSIFLPAFALAIVVPLIWAETRSVPAAGYVGLSGWQMGLIDGLAGVVMGLAFGLFAALPARKKGWRPAVVVCTACGIGLLLGWQRAPVWFLLALPICDLATYTVRLLTPPRDDEPPVSSEPAAVEAVSSSPSETLDSP